ncbi:hypothetical protein MHYP_G00067330 [Metynnis hypsauchen]
MSGEILIATCQQAPGPLSLPALPSLLPLLHYLCLLFSESTVLLCAKAKADSRDKAGRSSTPRSDNACFTVAQMSTLNKTLERSRRRVFRDVCIDWLLCGDGDMGNLLFSDYRIKRLA